MFVGLVAGAGLTLTLFVVRDRKHAPEIERLRAAEAHCLENHGGFSELPEPWHGAKGVVR